MLGCIQPISSPMMKSMLGFCAGCCAVAGVVTGPNNDNDINVVAPSNVAQDRLCQPPLLRVGVVIEGDLSLDMQLAMTLPSFLYCIRGSSPDASKAKMACGRVDRLR